MDKVQMSMHTLHAEERVLSLHQNCCPALRTEGYACVPGQKPHIAIRHILQKVRTAQLKERMKSIIQWRKDDKLDTENFQDS